METNNKDQVVEPLKVDEAIVAVSSDKATNTVQADKVNNSEIVIFPDVEKVKADVTEKFDKEASDLFEEYPDNKAFHFASDGLAFFQHNDARNHASTLEDKTVISKTRN